MMFENIKLLPVSKRGVLRSIILGFSLAAVGLAALFYGNMFVADIVRRMTGHSLGPQLFAASAVFFTHGTQIFLLFLTWISIGDEIGRCCLRLEPAAKLLVSSAGIWATWAGLPLLSQRLGYSFPINFYLFFLLVILFQALTLQVDNWLDKGAAMLLWVYSFQSLELLPTSLADGQAAYSILSGTLRNNEEAAIVSIAGTSIFLSLMAGAVISTWLLASYSVRLSQVRRLWNEQPADAGEDESTGLRQVSMVDIRSLVHDLKNPLAAIKGMAFTLRGGEREKADIMLNAANYMERMIGEILHEDQLNDVQAEPFFDRLTNHIRPFPWGKDVAVSIEPDAALETVAVNEIRLTRAILNVLDNAWRANRMAGTRGIELRVKSEAEFLEIEILDNGPGINSANNTLPNAKSGWGSTGLGLAFARKVTATHEGNLLLSERRDAPHGASVLISLPIRSNQK